MSDDSREPTEFGTNLLAQIKSIYPKLDDKFFHEIERLKNEESLQNFIYANLGDTMAFNHENAARIFGHLLAKHIPIPQMILACRFYQIIQCQNAIKIHTSLARSCLNSQQDKIEAGKTLNEAIQNLDRLLNNVTKLAEMSGLFKSKADEAKPHQPSRRPPS
jgi:hypothetical protein